MYPNDFDENDKFKYELGRYIDNLKEDTRFASMKGVSDLVKRMTETRKYIDYLLVYR